MIDASLNEVEGVAAKAARGAGLSWGHAEETGKAARWLAACGLDWAESLVALLSQHGALAAPGTPAAGVVRGTGGGAQSPLLLGPFLGDLGVRAGHLEIETLAQPLWLLPFAARAANEVEAVVVLAWNGVRITVWPDGGELSGVEADIGVASAVRVSWSQVRPGERPRVAARAFARAERSAIAVSDWQALAAFAARTCVPASERSRASGAGGGLTDVD